MSGRYPSEAELEKIRKWDRRDPDGWFKFIISIWDLAEMGTKVYRRGTTVKIGLHTLGWSGNEDIVYTMQEHSLWVLYWEASHRGGHYQFAYQKRKKVNDQA